MLCLALATQLDTWTTWLLDTAMRETEPHIKTMAQFVAKKLHVSDQRIARMSCRVVSCHVAMSCRVVSCRVTMSCDAHVLMCHARVMLPHVSCTSHPFSPSSIPPSTLPLHVPRSLPATTRLYSSFHPQHHVQHFDCSCVRHTVNTQLSCTHWIHAWHRTRVMHVNTN